ncbi:MAG: neutral/alkaline non-lysosomal ceramidase N-terminal domain-containing protein [Candidatus Omnitrophica bacterium]|nr:neutral/alkaline non-lysosomal ceramidase N-terminal domain-containing protein [Candidatus Omnitrophota bacterium]
MRPPLVLLLCGCLLGVIAWAEPNEGAADEVLAGAAYEPFSLPAGVPLAGYSRRKGKPSTGVHDPVGVRALVFRDGDTTAVLVSCDLLIVDERLFDAVHRGLLDAGLPQDLVLMLAATHTHSGPGGYGQRFFEKLSMGHFDPQVFTMLVQTVVRAVGRAKTALAPVELAYGTAQTDGLVQNRVEANGPVDPELAVVACYRPGQREPFAVLLSFAAHPTTLGAWNRQLSADYPGVAVRELEERLPGATALFFAGAVADQGPVKSGDGFERAERIGLALARHAADLLGASRPTPPGGLGAAQVRAPLPPAEVRLGRLTLPRGIGQRLVDDDATLSVVTAGEVAFLGAPCDLSAELGMRLKRAAQDRGLRPLLIGFASDYIGYCVPEALYRAKQYESSMAFNGPRAGELLVNHLKDMLDQLVRGDRGQETGDRSRSR